MRLVKEMNNPQTWFFERWWFIHYLYYYFDLLIGFRLTRRSMLVGCTFILFLYWAHSFAHSLFFFIFRLSTSPALSWRYGSLCNSHLIRLLFLIDIHWTTVLLLYYVFYPLLWCYYYVFDMVVASVVPIWLGCYFL